MRVCVCVGCGVGWGRKKDNKEREKENGDEASKKQQFRKAVSLQEHIHTLVEMGGTQIC